MRKSERHHILKQLITDNEISKQEDLLVLLQDKGVDITQATISRDIREIGITKFHDASGNIRYMISSEDESIHNPETRLEDLFTDLVINVVNVQFMNIVSTTLGTANVVAAEIDSLTLSGIVGSLAGTDTIVLISKTNEDATEIYQRLSSYIKH